MPTPYQGAFEVGARVRVNARKDLELFRKEWRFHHKLTAEQLECSGVVARITAVSYYHGGDPLYSLDKAPGIWHEECLAPEMPHAFRGDYLVMIFREALTIDWFHSDPGELFELGARRFRTAADADLTAFFDRLRDRSGRLLGFEFLPLVEPEKVLRELSALPYIRLTRDKNRVRVFLAGTPTAELTIVDDQAFGGRFYRSEQGELAITVQTEWLPREDVETIRSYHAPRA